MAGRTMVWFRRDLRLGDNPALVEAAAAGVVIPVFVWCPEEEGELQPGRASRWWLKHSLHHLDNSLKNLGLRLVMRKSHDTFTALLQIARATKATQIFYNHLYDPVSLVRDHRVKQGLTRCGILVHSFPGDCLYEPWEVFNDGGVAFTNYQAYWKKCQSMPFEPETPLLPPKHMKGSSRKIFSCTLDDLALEDDFEKGSNGLLARSWSPGWANAEKGLEAFLKGALVGYASSRRKGDGGATSMLSPHLHYGEISVRKIFYDVRLATHLLRGQESTMNLSVEAFLQAIGFRDYSRYLIFHFPYTHETSLLPNLRSFPWRVDEDMFKAWRQGRTGYPLVDAGMRELWATGWLHNRMRIVVASFCVKFLQLPWRWGMKYFWDTLLDADLESDILGWQYISGSLPDGHELDRMDDPTAEGQKFDPDGEYVRKWLPELSRIPATWIHHPWDAPANVLDAAGIELGLNYPRPIVEIAAARKRQQQAVSVMWEKEQSDQAGAPLKFSRDGFEVPLGPGPAQDKTDPPITGRHRSKAESMSSASSRQDINSPTESQQQAAATLLNLPVDQVLAVNTEEAEEPTVCCGCF